MLENIIYISLFLCVVLYAIFYFKKSFSIHLKYFLAYLFAVFSLELVSKYLYDRKHNTLLVYHLITFLEFNFLFLFFKHIIEGKLTKKLLFMTLYIFNIIYVLSSLYYMLKGDFFIKYNSIASISGSILIAIILFYFCIDFLSSNKILNYKKALSMWITFGLLVYYLGTIPITSIINLMDNIPKKEVVFLYNIQFGLSIFMYSCFIFGILWSQKKVR